MTAEDRSLVEASGVESGSRARVRLPSAEQTYPLKVCLCAGLGGCPLLPSAHPLCSECPVWENPASRALSQLEGVRPQDTQEHEDLRPQPWLCAPQRVWQRVPEGSPGHRRTGGWHPFVLCALPCPGAGQQAEASTFTETCVWAVVLGMWGTALGLLGVVSSLPPALCWGAASPVPSFALTRCRAGRRCNHGQKLCKSSSIRRQRRLCSRLSLLSCWSRLPHRLVSAAGPLGVACWCLERRDTVPTLGPHTLVGTQPQMQQL